MDQKMSNHKTPNDPEYARSLDRNWLAAIQQRFGAEGLLGENLCGQFVDRINSTRLVSDSKECQRMQNAK